MKNIFKFIKIKIRPANMIAIKIKLFNKINHIAHSIKSMDLNKNKGELIG